MSIANLAKGLPSHKVSKFTFRISAFTEIIGGNTFHTVYAEETLTVDPLAEIEHDSLIVWILFGGRPFLARVARRGKDQNGRFVPRGDDREAYSVNGINFTKADIGKTVYILGRVVGDDRDFPRESAAYKSVGAELCA